MELSQLLNIVWVMLGSVLVFFMQAGFAMVETGFTRAKNASNIIMKNVMDFTLGSMVFYAVGFALMFGDSIGGIFGGNGFFSPEKMGLTIFAELTPPVFIFFQTVF